MCVCFGGRFLVRKGSLRKIVCVVVCIEKCCLIFVFRGRRFVEIYTLKNFFEVSYWYFLRLVRFVWFSLCGVRLFLCSCKVWNYYCELVFYCGTWVVVYLGRIGGLCFVKIFCRWYLGIKSGI